MLVSAALQTLELTQYAVTFGISSTVLAGLQNLVLMQHVAGVGIAEWTFVFVGFSAVKPGMSFSVTQPTISYMGTKPGMSFRAAN
jgi:hypothetical protein